MSLNDVYTAGRAAGAAHADPSTTTGKPPFAGALLRRIWQYGYYNADNPRMGTWRYARAVALRAGLVWAGALLPIKVMQ